MLRRWRMRRLIVCAGKLKTNLRIFPFIGHSYLFIGSDEDRMKAFETVGRDAIAVGGTSKIWHCSELFLCVADPVVAEVLMTQCLEKHEIVNLTNFLIGNGSIFAPVPIWRPRRKAVAPTFSSKNLNQFAEVFIEQSNIMANLIKKEAGNGTFSLSDYIYAYSMNALCETTLGVKTNSQGVKNHTITVALNELFHIASMRLCQPWFHSDVSFHYMPCYGRAIKHRDTIWNYITKVIREKKQLIEEQNTNFSHNEAAIIKKSSSFIDLQMERSIDQRLTERELMEESLILLIAGTDTSATAAAYTILMLGRYPEVQEKVYQELREVFGESDRPATAKDLPHLKYLDIVIKESLRLFPPVPVIVRKLAKDVTLPSGETIVQGCGVLVNIWAMHRNPKYWGCADQFQPERFLDSTLKHPAAFIPFSYGPRNCLGYAYAMTSMKAVISSVARRYRVLPPIGVHRDDPVRTKYDVMMKPVDDFKLRLELRK